MVLRCVFGDGKDLVLGFFSFKLSPDTDGDGYLTFIGLGIVYEEMSVAHIGEDKVGRLCVFLIEGMIDKTDISMPGRAALGVISHSRYSFCILKALTSNSRNAELLDD